MNPDTQARHSQIKRAASELLTVLATPETEDIRRARELVQAAALIATSNYTQYATHVAVKQKVQS